MLRGVFRFYPDAASAYHGTSTVHQDRATPDRHQQHLLVLAAAPPLLEAHPVRQGFRQPSYFT